MLLYQEENKSIFLFLSEIFLRVHIAGTTAFKDKQHIGWAQIIIWN